MKPLRKYVSVNKYVRRRNDIMWKTLGVEYTEASTQFMVKGRGYGNTDVMGKIDVTYYVAFRQFTNGVAMP